MTDWTCPACGYSTDDPIEIAEHDCDDEEVLLALGNMPCATCERWGTVLSTLRCHESPTKRGYRKPCSTMMRSRFHASSSGTVATPAAIETMQRWGIDAFTLLARHVTGDWGDLDEEDK